VSTRRFSITRSLVVALSALAILLAGCAVESTGKAQGVWQETMQADPRYASFALELAAKSDHAFAQRLLLDSIASTNYQHSLAAVKSFVASPPEEARAGLRQVFETKRGPLKLNSAVALGRLGDDEAVAWIRGEIESGLVLDASAMDLIAAVGEPGLLEPLLHRLMENDDLSIRDEAYLILAAIEQPWAGKMLAEGLDNEHGEDRLGAIVAVGLRGDATMATLLPRFVNTQGLVLDAIEAMGRLRDPGSLPHLSKLLDHDDSRVRIFAAAAVLPLGEEAAALPVLEAAVEDEDPLVRQRLAEQLEAVAADSVVPLLVRLAGDDERDVRLAALRALADRGAAPAVEHLQGVLGDTDNEAVSVALSGLARHGDSSLVASIEPLLESNDPYVRLSAANAIMAVGGGQD